ncbi:hypothetical protein ACHAW6_012955 [Cyclotella cf. meneghiniana]
MSTIDPITSDEDLPSHRAASSDATSSTTYAPLSSLIIPITTSTNNNNYDPSTKSGLFIEIFPEELATAGGGGIRPDQLSQVLRDESAPIQTWCEASLLYIRMKKEREGCDLLNGAVDKEGGEDIMLGSNTADKLRLLASAGISALALANRLASSGEKREEELRSVADARFTKADNINQVYPPTWIGKGMLNLALGRVDQARFFFEQLTMRECGEILPALLGMAAVKFAEKDYAGAQQLYGRAMQKFPSCGASVRVGYGLACYKLGQIDRAKAAFQRAVDIDAENVEALLALAILEMSSLDSTVQDGREYRSKAEKVMKMISMANMIDSSNGMVLNHLANHYFWKWSPVLGVNVSVERGSCVVKGNGVGNALEAGDRIRIGDFETSVVGEGEEDGVDESVRIKDAWKGASSSGLKLWKKDYDRVLSLAKSAYSSTSISEIQAESLFMMARVHHARNDMEQANKFYDKACKHSPELSPARFGLAQTLIWDEAYEEAAAHLRLLLMTSPNATDALAALGLLEVKAGKDRREAFVYLKKAIDLDPFNADLVLIEALALQQHESDYLMSLDRYRKAVRLLEAQGKVVPAVVLTNMGVLCHETKNYDEALEMYGKALKALDDNPDIAESADDEGGEDVLIRHNDNSLFWTYKRTGVRVEKMEDDVTKLAVMSSAHDLDTLGIKVGADISIGGDVETTITEIFKGEGGKVELFVKTSLSIQSEQEISVKKSNGRLRNPLSISVAFNLARLHEAAGRINSAVELHKAIVKRHPSYVNSYLRLACIARDCGSLKDCSEWLKSAVAVAPGNPEVLTLVGNLHLSLCDWAPAQKVFDQLLTQKVPKVEAYSMLSLGNIYFNNLNAPKKYTKHLNYAADFYRRILTKDKANAYAANGLGTVLAEKGELFKAKEVFNRVREVSGDTILDALLNLGHIYLAQKRHPEALQMYQSYMNRTRSSGAPITSKSQDEDESEVLLYISFAYFDWARQTELFNDVKAAPADERYQKCIEYIEMAIKKSKKENVTLRYNWCMVKLQAANCVLQKVNRNIRRTAQEVKHSLDGLEESLAIVQTMLQWKSEGKKVTVSTGMLTDFVNQCKHNIDSAKSHLNEELKKEKEAQVLRDFQRIEAEANEKQRLLTAALEKEREAQEMEERERKARQKMEQVNSLVDGWKQAAVAAEKEKDKASAKKGKGSGNVPPGGVDDEAGIFDTDVAPTNTSALFDESDDEDEADDASVSKDEESKKETPRQNETEKDLFGDSSSDEDDEKPKKRKKTETDVEEEDDDERATKKKKVDDA